MLVLLRRQRGLRFMRDLSTLAYDFLDVVGRPYDGVDDVVMYVHETMIDPRKSDHPLVAVGVVAQTPCDAVANLNLHCGLAEVDVAAVAQIKAHQVLHHPVKPLPIAKICRSEVIREVAKDRHMTAAGTGFRTIQARPKDLPASRW
jgi:hypothetical protein